MGGYGFWRLAQEDPAHIAVIDAQGKEVSAGELLRGANQVVHGLRALGLRRGDSIAVMLTNEVPMLEVYLAATQAGLYMTPINSHLAAPEVAYILADSDAKAVFCNDRTGDACKLAVEEISFPAEARFATSPVAGFRPYADLKAGRPDTLPDDRKAGGPMTYTSGTTGKPKGVRRALPDMAPEPIAEINAMFLQLFGITPKDDGVHLVVSPLYHTAVLNFCTNHLHFGHTVVLMDKWTPEGTLERIERYRVTTSHMVPTQFRRLLALPDDVKKRFDPSVPAPRHPQRSALPGRREEADDRVVGQRASTSTTPPPKGGGTMAASRRSGWRIPAPSAGPGPSPSSASPATTAPSARRARWARST